MKNWKYLLCLGTVITVAILVANYIWSLVEDKKIQELINDLNAPDNTMVGAPNPANENY